MTVSFNEMHGFHDKFCFDLLIYVIASQQIKPFHFLVERFCFCGFIFVIVL
jgi:hypothetical protein